MGQPAGRFAPVRRVDETGSTNEDAAALLGDGTHAGLTIVADHQTRGAGRKGRTWTDRPGSALLCTTILPEAIPAANLWIVPFWTALAVRRALGACGIAVELHWPNDLLLEENKIAGILCVSRVSGTQAWAAAGVGVNLVRPESGEGEILPPPAYCDDVAPVTRDELLERILHAYDASFPMLGDPDAIARQWERDAAVPGKRYCLLRDGETQEFSANAIALASGGGLLVERDDGTREIIALADARALR